MHGFRPALLLVLAFIALVALSCSQQQSQDSSEEPTSPAADSEKTSESSQSDDGGGAAPASPTTSTRTYSFEDEQVEGDLEKPAPDAVMAEPAKPEPQPMNAPAAEALAEAEDIAPAAGAPMAPESTGGGGGATMPPAAGTGHSATAPGAGPAAMPPAAANGHGAKPPTKNGHSGSKVLSYFQKSRTLIDTRRAFGFVLIPKVAVSDQDKRTQKEFCAIMLASMDFMTPGAVASAPREVLATYWPIVGSRASFEISDAFARRNCDDLIAWYDHALARSLAAKAGVAELTGPLLITWPSAGSAGDAGRDPLIVDFSKANHTRATKALQYWFRQLKSRPELWTSRIREGTIRAELADAVNDTAGVMLAVLAGKWDSLTVVAASP
jgi:hypothetical protein